MKLIMVISRQQKCLNNEASKTAIHKVTSRLCDSKFNKKRQSDKAKLNLKVGQLIAGLLIHLILITARLGTCRIWFD